MDAVVDNEMVSAAGQSRLRRRAWPLATTLVLLSLGMVYSLLWGPVVQHHPYWIDPGDLWSTYRVAAHYVGWGDLGGVYGAGAGLVTFPGILLLLAPVAMLTGAFGMSESFPKYLNHPTAWLVLGPFEILLSAVALFSCDALAERLGINAKRRVVLCLAEGIVLWNVSVLWGHPEDALAVGLAVYALVFALDDRWTGAGWLFGAAMATQPLVLLMFPVLLALTHRDQVAGFIARCTLPFVALLVTPLLSQFHATAHALLDQPNYPGVDHATPWTALAPVLSGKGHTLTVAAGPGRVVALIMACGLGWWARRWRHDPEMIAWAAALALALRCFTESVMVDFYVWPALALGLVVAARFGRWRFLLAVAGGILTTVVAQWRLGWLPWWSLVTAGIVVVLVAATRTHRKAIEEVSDLALATVEREPPPVLVGALR